MRTRVVAALFAGFALTVSAAFAGEAPHFFKCIGSESGVWGSCPEGCQKAIWFRVKNGNEVKAIHKEGSPWHYTWKEEWGTGAFEVQCTCQEVEKDGDHWATAATYTVRDWRPKTMVVSRHPECDVPAQVVSQWLDNATLLMRDDDGPGDGSGTDDVEACVSFGWNNTLNQFTNCTNPVYNYITSEELARHILLNETSGSLLLVSRSNGVLEGIALTGGDRCLVVCTGPVPCPNVFAHEFGHMAGLSHRNDAGAIMKEFLSIYGVENEFNLSESDAVRSKWHTP